MNHATRRKEEAEQEGSEEGRKEGRKQRRKVSSREMEMTFVCIAAHITVQTQLDPTSSLSLSHCLEFSPPIPWLLFSYATSVVPVGKRRAACFRSRSRSCGRWRTRAMRLRESTRLLRWKLCEIVGLWSARIFFHEAPTWNREVAYKIVSFPIHSFLLFLINRYLSLRLNSFN